MITLGCGTLLTPSIINQVELPIFEGKKYKANGVSDVIKKTVFYKEIHFLILWFVCIDMCVAWITSVWSYAN